LLDSAFIMIVNKPAEALQSHGVIVKLSADDLKIYMKLVNAS